MTTGTRAVRRTRPAAVLVAAPAVVLAAALVVALGGCAGIGQPAPYDSPGINGLLIPTPMVDPEDYVDDVDNLWLALEPGSRRTYDLTGDAAPGSVLVVDVLAEPVPVAGLSATAVQTTTDLGGGPAAVRTDLYVQDEAGNVWLVGADADGSGWRAGTDGAEAGLAMPADPRLGDGWLTYDVPGMPRASRTIEDQSAERLQTRNEADTTTRTVYEKGVGLVGVIDLDAGWTAALRG